MNSKLPSELGDGGLGDITGVMNNQSVSDYRWLNVDPEEYRKFEALPKQNLDSIPELTEFLAREPDERVPSLVIQRPITVVNSNPLDCPDVPSRASTLENLKKKVASYVVANLPSSEIQKRLTLEYSPEQIRSASSEIREILEERGLLGNIYINAAHYPKCHQPKDPSHRFVARYASGAGFVLAKDSCANCVCNRSGMCSSFKKVVVSSVPYNQQTLGTYVPSLVSQNRIPGGSLKEIPKDETAIKGLLRQAFRRLPVVQNPEIPRTAHYQRPEVKPVISDEDVQKFIERQSAQKTPFPSPQVLRAILALTQGHLPIGLQRSTDGSIREIAREHGIVGHTYLDIDALGGPKPTLGFIRTKGLEPDFLVGRLAYELSDELTQLVRGYKIYATRPALNLEHLRSALMRAVHERRMEASFANEAFKKSQAALSVDWDSVVSQVNLYIPPMAEKTPDYTAPKMSFFHGDTSKDVVAVNIIPEEVRRTISHLMNTGLCGSRLQKAVLSRYTREDLAQIPEIGQQLAAVDGVQGFYHIDPTAYPDYGGGCNSGSKTLRHNQAANVLACSKCTGCRLQTAPGWCSKYAKKLVRSIPESAHREGAERRILKVVQDTRRIENPVAQFELSSDINVDLNGSKSNTLDISIADRSISD